MQVSKNAVEWPGFCPICATQTIFRVTGPWHRDQLLCAECGSIPRERALMLALENVAPDWRTLRIHESSPIPRGVSLRLQKECPAYVATQLFLDVPLGGYRDGFRCEDLERQTFETEQFDLVITQDVMEHVFEPALVYSEIWRTLCVCGRYIHTTPIIKRHEKSRRRAERRSDGSIHHLLEPVYHANAIDACGSLVTFDYGYDLPELIAGWTSFDIEVRRFVDTQHGILGEMTDVIICTKSAKYAAALSR